MSRVKSPCIGVCSTSIGGEICRGCKRYMHEIVQWNAYSDEERQNVLDRLNQLLSQVVASKVHVFDEGALVERLKLNNVRYDAAAPVHTWVFSLLKAGAGQIAEMEEYGCRVTEECSKMSLLELRDSIDEDFLVLSTVHYQRYFDMSEAPK